MPGPDPEEPFRILVMCTANICRSVMAERFLRRHAESGALPVAVGSCGMLTAGEPASAAVVGVLAERGLDATDHRSRRVDPDLVAAHDLVVTMERRHARELTLANEGVSPRVHTLAGLVQALDGAQARVGTPAERVARVAERRSAAALLGSGEDEIDDPHGRSLRLHRRTADRLEGLCAGLLGGLFGGPDTR